MVGASPHPETNPKDENMSTNPISSNPSQALPVAGSYRIDSTSSTVSFRVAAMFGLSKAKGTMTIESGDVMVGETTDASSVAATLAAARFSTANANRDKHVLSQDFLDAATFPTIQFRSTGVVANGNAWIVRGSLTVHGTTSPVDLAITSVSVTPTGFTVNATTMVDRTAFGVAKMKGMVGRTVDVVLTAHWESDVVEVTSAVAPGLLYDYSGFPPETYRITYSAPGAPALAAQISALLGAAGLVSRPETQRSWDHGVFIPLKVMYPHRRTQAGSIGGCTGPVMMTVSCCRCFNHRWSVMSMPGSRLTLQDRVGIQCGISPWRH